MIKNERIKTYPASQEQMEKYIASETDEELKKAYGEMLELMDLRGIREAALVCHGGSIMSIMEALADPHRDYFTGIKGNGCGYLVQTDYNMWKTGRKTCTVLREIGE